MGSYTMRCNAQAAVLVLLFGDRVASENFYFSLKGGVNFTTLEGLDGVTMKPGINWGLLANIKLSERFYLVPEFSILSGKGAKNIAYISSSIPELDLLLGEPDRSKMDLNYIELPIIARYKLGERLHVGTGPQFSVLIGSKNVYRNEIQPEDQLIYHQGSQLEWNRFDFGWAAELTVNVSKLLGGKGLDLHARYMLGFSDIIKDNPGGAVTNSGFQFTVSFPFILDEDD